MNAPSDSPVPIKAGGLDQHERTVWNKNAMKKQYLGDSVYAELDSSGVLVLTTENNGGPPLNVIYLDPEVYAQLVRYATAALQWREKTPMNNPICLNDGMVRVSGTNFYEMEVPKGSSIAGEHKE